MSAIPEALAAAIDASNEGKLAVCLVLVTHPAFSFIMHSQRQPGKTGPLFDNGPDPYDAWRSEDLPWIGAALWAHPAGLEKGLISAKAGSLFSHVHCSENALNEAFNIHLGPWGCSIGGSGSNPSAFERDAFPAPLSIAHCETRSGGGFPREGKPRPSHWPAPFPLQRFDWDEKTGPPNAPDFGAAALATVATLREQAFQALREEGYSDELTEPLRGGIAAVPARVALHFLRQDHPMFGASALDADKRAEALTLFDLARSAFEFDRIAKATGPGSLGSRPSRM